LRFNNNVQATSLATAVKQGGREQNKAVRELVFAFYFKMLIVNFIFYIEKL
jgi:hypothetical protein